MWTAKGVFPVIPTIFDKSGAIDMRGTLRVVDYVIDAGASGVVFPGLASEHALLTQEEREAMVSAIGGRLDQRVEFVVGASADHEDNVLRFAELGAAASACAIMVMVPHSMIPDTRRITEFFHTIGSASPLPIVLQNAPSPSKDNLSLEQVAEIVAAHENIRYVKEEGQPTGQRISRMQQLSGHRLDAVIGGAGARNLIDEMSRGVTGTMPACEITELHVAMLNAYERGDISRARDLFDRSLPLLNIQATFRWRLTKEVLFQRGIIDSAFTRAQGPSLDDQDKAEVRLLLERLQRSLEPDLPVASA